MSIAIIGSKGYIGSYLLQYFGSNAHGDPEEETLYHYETVIYLGGYSSRNKCKTWEDTYNHNVLDITRIATLMNKNQLLIFASTGAIASSSDTRKMDLYTLSMYERELAMSEAKLKTIGLRLGGVVGLSPVMRKDLSYNAMIHSAKTENIIRVNSPDSYRSILWIQDLAKCVEICIKDSYKIQERHSVFNLASYDISIIDIARDISQCTGASIQILEDTGVPSFKLDTKAFCETFCYTFQGTRKLVIQDLYP